MKIYMDVDYINGHLRYGHVEGDIDFTKEQEEEFQMLLKKEVNEEDLTDEEQDLLDDYKERICDHCEFVVDDYDVDDYGNFCWEDLLY